MRNSSLIQKHSTKQKEKKQETHAINWGIQVKKGLLMRKRHLAKSEKIFQNRNKQTNKKAGILIPRNLLQP